MTASEITLNIAVNLGRVSRWAQEGKEGRIRQFLDETEMYLEQLAKAKKNPRFQKTYDSFYKSFYDFKNRIKYDYDWADETLTWANILTHRAKLAD